MGQDRFEVRSPVDGHVVGEYPVFGEEDISKAVGKARFSYDKWKAVALKQRARLLLKGASVIADMADEIVDVITSETGKKKLEAMMTEVYLVADLFHYYGKNVEDFLSPVKVPTPMVLPRRRSYYQFHPRGVIAVISPWNYPFLLSMGPLISAMAAGNGAVLKPSSQTTGCGVIATKIFKKAGFPKDLVQVVTGPGGKTGDALLAASGIDMFFFTGSTGIGRQVAELSAKRLIPFIMELGGKDALIVLGGADLDRAANAAVFASFENAGQTCIGTERCYVEAAVYDEFVLRVKNIVKNLKAAPGEGSYSLGPMITKAQQISVSKALADATAKGAKVIAKGSCSDKGGQFLMPTCLTDVPPGTVLMDEETFGPVLPIIKVKDADEAIRLANDSKYGLSGSVFGRLDRHTKKVVDSLDTGSVSVNDVLNIMVNPNLPFGGVKRSGMGFYHSKEGLRSFCKMKSVIENKNWSKKKELYYYPYDVSDYELLKSGLRFFYSEGIGERLRNIPAALKLYRKML